MKCICNTLFALTCNLKRHNFMSVNVLKMNVREPNTMGAWYPTWVQHRMSVMGRLWCSLDWCFCYSFLSSRTPSPPSLREYKQSYFYLNLSHFLTINRIGSTIQYFTVSQFHQLLYACSHWHFKRLNWLNLNEQIAFESDTFPLKTTSKTVDCQDCPAHWCKELSRVHWESTIWNWGSLYHRVSYCISTCVNWRDYAFRQVDTWLIKQLTIRLRLIWNRIHLKFSF